MRLVVGGSREGKGGEDVKNGGGKGREEAHEWS